MAARNETVTTRGLNPARSDCHDTTRVTPHTLRHTAASDVLDKCGNVRTVQTMLGHQSLATTQIYLRRADLGQLREAMAGRDYTTVISESQP